MTFEETLHPPAIGTPVTVTDGEWQGEKGTVYDLQGPVVRVRVEDKVFGISFRDLQWVRVMPPIGTTVRVNYVKGIEGMTGIVQQYMHISTQHITDTDLGWHYGLLAAVVDIEGLGPVPFLPDNLLWDRFSKDVLSTPEESPLPPAGIPHGEMSSTQLAAIHTKISNQLHAEPPPAYETRTALYQLKLPPYRSRLAIRTGPCITEPLHSHLRNGDIVSLILPQPSMRAPEWWELSNGGWAKKSPEEWVALVMSCGVCKLTLPTEQALMSHFESDHPGKEFDISVSGDFAFDDDHEYPLSQVQKRNSRSHQQQMQLMRRRAPVGDTPEGPAWFVMEKPRRGYQ
eukprot:TRINITY_DN1264_c0_g1_i1.p1 TRINITY_DN1264_c0_g1~~TRINITY_DN1264_c0_g1_i1.p1  ORF type:complete len:342 (+),score=51.64 TRINITY_DN1264_c0_g1_i1:35-1060(+)